MTMFMDPIGADHEFPHAPDTDPAYNESSYYNFASAGSGVVGWLRVAIQPNRPSAQATALVFLPTGQTLFSFERVPSAHEGRLAVGGVGIEVIDPHRRQRITFDGSIAVFDDPRVLAEPGALRAAAREDASIDLSVAANGIPFGADGADPDHALEETMAVGHYEQFVRLEGAVRVRDRTFDIRGGGLRDHSWGPRDWSGPLNYRWVTATFDDGSALMTLEVAQRDGGITRRAATVSGGIATGADLHAVSIEWTPDDFCRRIRCEITTGTGELVLSGAARAPERFAPLRHVTTAQDGTRSVTRIGYSAYEFTTGDGRRGMGIVEVLDQLPGQRVSER